VTGHQHPGDGAVPVGGGRMTAGMVRRGDQLLRPMGSWSPAVHEYLRHLEAAGFGGAPRLLGIEGDREVLEFIDGDVASDPEWQPGRGHRLPPCARTEQALRGAARLIRALHEASASFRPAVTSYRFRPRAPGSGELISHGDLGPWNTVYRDGLPVAFIDWDAAQPVSPLDDLAAAAWTFVPLAPPRQLREAGFDPPGTCRPGCGPSPTPTGSPTGPRSRQHCGGPCCTTPSPCAGSSTSARTSPARYSHIDPGAHARLDLCSLAPGRLPSQRAP